MIIDEVQEEIRSVVDDRHILVTPNIIAEYLGYVRPMYREVPEVVTFPRLEDEIDDDEIREGFLWTRTLCRGWLVLRRGTIS